MINIQLLKQIWSNKRYKALIELSLYIIFFLVIILIVKFDKPSTKKELSNLEKFNNKNNYTFKVEINDDTFIGEMDDSLKIKYNDYEYIYNSDDKLNDFKYNEIVPYLDTKYIYKQINNVKYDSITKYSDNKISKTYIIDNIELITYEYQEIFEIDIKINDNMYKITYN